MILAHRIALEPNNVQATYLAKAAGTARFAYNWALAEWQKQYQAGGKPCAGALRRQLNRIKREQFPWMLEVTKNAPQMAIIQLGQAFSNFFTKRATCPKFRKKGSNDRFSLTNDQFSVQDRRIRIPNLGWVRMRESLRFRGKIVSATLSRRANRWFVSIAVDMPDVSYLRQAENQGPVGVDLGVSALATLSTGEVVVGPKPHRAHLQRARRLSRSLSRKQKGSRNRQKAKNKLARLHARIACSRENALHQLTSMLTRRFSLIGIESLNVRGMLQNRCLARAVSDMGFHEFRRQTAYKSALRGGLVHLASPWFPSSKTCSNCGVVVESLPLAARHWKCPACQRHHDRDMNAAINLKNLAVSSTVSACGEEGSGSGRRTRVKPASEKQESSIMATFG